MDLSKISSAQRRVLDAVGCGNHSPIAARRTIEAMLAKGLLFEIEPIRLPIFGGLHMNVRQFDMPIHVHIAWCDLCSSEYEGSAPKISEG